MKRKDKISENYLEKIPFVTSKIHKVEFEGDAVTLVIHNKGIMNTFAQKLLKKPRYSYIHLDENGSFVWRLIDGSRTILEMGESVEAHFGKDSHPLYERLTKFFQVLSSYGFVDFK